MQRGCRLVDYRVDIGLAVCNGSALYDNKLTCRPPDHEPQHSNNDSLCDDSLNSIFVRMPTQFYWYSTGLDSLTPWTGLPISRISTWPGGNVPTSQLIEHL
jgi:hypothetical protein